MFSICFSQVLVTPGDMLCLQIAVEGALVFGLRKCVFVQADKLHDSFQQRIQMLKAASKVTTRVEELLPFFKPPAKVAPGVPADLAKQSDDAKANNIKSGNSPQPASG